MNANGALPPPAPPGPQVLSASQQAELLLAFRPRYPNLVAVVEELGRGALPAPA